MNTWCESINYEHLNIKSIYNIKWENYSKVYKNREENNNNNTSVVKKK